jgi:predicted metalloprotease with PDZ domain
VGEGAEPYVRDVQALEPRGWRPLEARKGSWFLAHPCHLTCTVRYTVVLGDAARAENDTGIARSYDGAIEAPPSTWLLRPARSQPRTPFRFHVTSAAGDRFVSGVFPSADGSDTYEGFTDNHYQLAYAAFGRLRVRDLHGGRIRVAMLPGPVDADEAIDAWVETSARAVEGFYGVFPVPHLLILVRPTTADSVGFGTTMGHSGAAISIDVGVHTSPSDFRDDWVLVHEMVHTALPDLEGPQHWLEEGLATYIEPIARHRAGLVTSEGLWAEWVHGMPNGLPMEGDRGLDRTPTWGRTYWGGALFCLLADVEIRRRTNNARSLGDALRAVLKGGGSIAESWPVSQVLDLGDAATGVPVLQELYGRMARAPVDVDLQDLWKRLGVFAKGATVTFDDAAPLTHVRDGIADDGGKP